MNLLNHEVCTAADTGHFHHEICISWIAVDFFFPGFSGFLPCAMKKEQSAD